MRSPLRHLLLLSALAAVGCKQSDSILFVTVYAPRTVVATDLNVTVLAGFAGDNTNFDAMMETVDEPINWPASFTVALARSHMPPITINVDAIDSGRNTVAFGSTKMQHIQIGGQTDIAIQLMEGTPPDMTGTGGMGGGGGGGSGGGGGKGGGGQGGGGTGGGAGQGGASGQGGAGGLDAAAGDGGSGLDAATD
jgi:hypothetical protein